jgi:hypothetical protein
LKVKTSAAKDFAQTEKPHGNRESSQAQEGQLEVNPVTEELYKPQVKAEAMASKAYELTHTIAPGKVQGTYRDRVKCKKRLGNCMRAVKRQATINHCSQT